MPKRLSKHKFSTVDGDKHVTKINGARVVSAGRLSKDGVAAMRELIGAAKARFEVEPLKAENFSGANVSRDSTS